VRRTRVAHPLASAEVGALQRTRNRQAAHSPHAAEDHRNASTEAFVVEQNGVSDSVHVSVFGVDGIVFEAQRIPDLVWQFLGFWFHHNSRVTIRRRLCAERSRAVAGGYDTSPRIGADYMESV